MPKPKMMRRNRPNKNSKRPKKSLTYKWKDKKYG